MSNPAGNNPCSYVSSLKFEFLQNGNWGLDQRSDTPSKLDPRPCYKSWTMGWDVSTPDFQGFILAPLSLTKSVPQISDFQEQLLHFSVRFLL